jgi:hypothetical protein
MQAGAACVGAIPNAKLEMDWIQVRDSAEETGFVYVTRICSDLWACCSVMLTR